MTVLLVWCRKGKRKLLNYFIKWLEAIAIPSSCSSSEYLNKSLDLVYHLNCIPNSEGKDNSYAPSFKFGVILETSLRMFANDYQTN